MLFRSVYDKYDLSATPFFTVDFLAALAGFNLALIGSQGEDRAQACCLAGRIDAEKDAHGYGHGYA